MKNIILRWGLVGAIGVVILGVLFYLFDVEINSKLRYVTLLVSIGVIIAAMMEFRDKENNGYATFGNLFLIGLGIGCVIGLIGGIWAVVYPLYFDTGMYERILIETEINLEEAGLDKIQIKEALKWTELMFKPWIVYLMSLLGNVFGAIIISLPAGLILKKDKSIFDEQISDTQN
jgi:hypothetical protein